MSKATPGPWAWDEPPNWLKTAARIYHEADGKFEPVAQVQLSGWPRRVGLANARLIAAAPDLLEALEGVLRFNDSMTVEFDAAIAAICKAKGTT